MVVQYKINNKLIIYSLFIPMHIHEYMKRQTENYCVDQEYVRPDT